MTELLASRVLRQWGDYRRTGFVYLPSGGDDLAAAVAQINRDLPGSAALTTAAAAFADTGGPGDRGPAWAGRPDAAAVVEREAGDISPAAMRDAIVADLAKRGAAVTASGVDSVAPGPAGPVRVTAAGETSEYDAVVLAAGAWTPSLLRASGLAAGGYRTKVNQHSVWAVGDYCPPAFCDEEAGLYGKPAAGGGLLLGVPTAAWDVPPGRPPADPRWHERALELATRLFPLLEPGPVRERVTGVDCYTDPPVLSLRPVQAAGPGVFTFTGGSGGAAKTALAASAAAAVALAGPGPSGEPDDVPRVSPEVRR
jgi:glycine/D-amino acid oxidase-like deaminating enzyme